jgi:hypothetical protein
VVEIIDEIYELVDFLRVILEELAKGGTDAALG